MAEKKESTPKELSKFIEQSMATLERMDKRIQNMQTDLTGLATSGRPGQTPGTGTIAPWTESGAFQHPLFSPGGGIETRGARESGSATGVQQGAFAGQGSPGQPPQGLVHPLFQSPTLQSPFQAPVYAGVNPPVGLFQTPLPGSAGGGFAVQGMTGGAGPGPEAASGRRRRPSELPEVQRQPTATLSDAGERFLVQFDLPGVKKEDLEVTINDRTLTVRAKAPLELGEGDILHTERSPVQYERSLLLPSEVKASKAKAKLKDGVLTLEVDKKVPTEGAHKVDISTT